MRVFIRFIPLLSLLILLGIYSQWPFIHVSFFMRNSCPELSFSKTKLPIIALASYPGSGNTWSRHLIQKMTGIYTGAPYDDKYLKTHGFPGEGRSDDSVVVVKTHDLYKSSSPYEKAILLVRSPFEAMLAEFRYDRNFNFTENPKLHAYISAWEKKLDRDLIRYKRLYLSWLQHKALLPIAYANMKMDLGKELAKMLSFINVTGDIQCALKDAEGNCHRSHSKDASVDFFYSGKRITEVNGIIRELQEKFRTRFKDIAVHMNDWLL